MSARLYEAKRRRERRRIFERVMRLEDALASERARFAAVSS